MNRYATCASGVRVRPKFAGGSLEAPQGLRTVTVMLLVGLQAFFDEGEAVTEGVVHWPNKPAACWFGSRGERFNLSEKGSEETQRRHGVRYHKRDSVRPNVEPCGCEAR